MSQNIKHESTSVVPYPGGSETPNSTAEKA